MRESTVFFSWQSDVKPAAATRTLIQGALEAACKQIAADDSIAVVPVVDRDTLGLGGAPNIRDAIFDKIDAASAFVADVTLVNSASEDERLTPNPNVLVELGYAIKSIGWPRIVLVMNSAYGRPVGRPEDLPFDVRQHVCLRYTSAPDAEERASERKKLQGMLREALTTPLTTEIAETNPVALDVTYRKEGHSTGERHDYVLELKLHNNGGATIENWLITAQVPSRIMTPDLGHGYEVQQKRTRTERHFRFPSKEWSGRADRIDALYPGETIERTVPYYIDDKIFHEGSVFEEPIIVRAFVNDQLVDEVVKPVREMNRF